MECLNNPTYRRRMIKLAKFLLSLSPRYNIDHFNMTNFYKHRGQVDRPDDAIEVFNTHICGTTACAVGHLPMLFPTIVKKFGEEQRHYSTNELWRELSGYVLGIDMESEEDGEAWQFLFGSSWGFEGGYEATSWAVADRIAYLLSGKYDIYDSRVRQGKACKFLSAEKGWTTVEHLNKCEVEYIKAREYA